MINMMMRTVMTAEGKDKVFLEELSQLDEKGRKEDKRVEPYVLSLKEKWGFGTRIERLATLGWNQYESEEVLHGILSNLSHLRKEYEKQQKENGRPPPLRDEDLELYESTVKKIKKQN